MRWCRKLRRKIPLDPPFIKGKPTADHGCFLFNIVEKLLSLQSEIQQRTHYQRIGGEPVLRELVHRFYAIMDELPEAYGIRRMHAASLDEMEQKFFEFLSGWTGGPQLYVEHYGHPRLRMRHLPFSIGRGERDQWMLCMNQALNEVVQDEALRRELSGAFAKVAEHMRNRAENIIPLPLAN